MSEKESLAEDMTRDLAKPGAQWNNNLPHASENQKQELNVKRELETSSTKIEKMFGSADNLIADLDKNHNGELDSDEVLDACQSINNDGDKNKADALWNTFRIVRSLPDHATEYTMSAYDLIKNRNYIDESLKKGF